MPKAELWQDLNQNGHAVGSLFTFALKTFVTSFATVIISLKTMDLGFYFMK